MFLRHLTMLCTYYRSLRCVTPRGVVQLVAFASSMSPARIVHEAIKPTIGLGEFFVEEGDEKTDRAKGGCPLPELLSCLVASVRCCVERRREEAAPRESLTLSLLTHRDGPRGSSARTVLRRRTSASGTAYFLALVCPLRTCLRAHSTAVCSAGCGAS
jgi:hypothetical protein